MPTRPMAPCAQRRVEPFRYLRQALQSSPDGLCHHPRREPGGQRIDRLNRFDLLGLVRRDDIIGMRDLWPAVVVIDRAADDALGADRQQPLQMVAFDAEINEAQRAGAVRAVDPIGAPAKTGFMPLDADLQRDDWARPVARIELAERRRGAAIDDPDRQMPQPIDAERAGGALDEPAELRSDAGQYRDRRKEPIEQSGAHPASDNHEDG